MSKNGFGWKALVSGIAGACALTLIHEGMRHTLPDAPRMDVLGMRAIAGVMQRFGYEPPAEKPLHDVTLAGDLAVNTLLFSIVGTQRGPAIWAAGALTGLAAGLGTLVLPGPLGLGTKPSHKTRGTEVMTVGWYLAGGLVAAAVASLMQSSEE